MTVRLSRRTVIAGAAATLAAPRVIDVSDAVLVLRASVGLAAFTSPQ